MLRSDGLLQAVAVNGQGWSTVEHYGGPAVSGPAVAVLTLVSPTELSVALPGPDAKVLHLAPGAGLGGCA